MNLKQAHKLSIIFSFRNEADVLPELIKRVRAALKDRRTLEFISNYELIFVNDASTDHSLDILLKESERDNDIRIITMSRRFGVTPCVLAGMEFSSGDLVIYMDADLQDPAEVIPELLTVWASEENIDVVHTLRQSRKGESAVKLFLTRLGYLILNKTAAIPLPVEAGDFKLLSRRAVNHLLHIREKRPFLRGLICWIGFKQKFLPYHRDRRYAGRTKFSVLSGDVINNFLESALISFSSLPLKIAFLVGFFAIILDLALLVHVLLEKIQGKAIPGWTAIMIAVIFAGSVQLFCLGIIGLYINAIYEESKGRPNYIIESTFGFPSSSQKQS